MILCVQMRQHLPNQPHSSFSREAQSKLQNILCCDLLCWDFSCKDGYIVTVL